MSTCGTKGGYTAHWRRGEPACPACTEAKRLYDAERQVLRNLSPVAAAIERRWQSTEPKIEPDHDGRWRLRAACRGMDPNLFVPEREDAQQAGKKVRPICAACPVQTECLEWAMSVPQQEGYAAGTSYRERRRLRAETREAS